MIVSTVDLVVLPYPYVPITFEGVDEVWDLGDFGKKRARTVGQRMKIDVVQGLQGKLAYVSSALCTCR